MNNYDYITNAFTKDGDNTNLDVNNLNVSCITSKNNKFELDSSGNLTVQSINAKSMSAENLINIKICSCITWTDFKHAPETEKGIR